MSNRGGGGAPGQADGTGRTDGTDGRDGRAGRTGGTERGEDGRKPTSVLLKALKAAPFHLFKAVSGLTQKMWVSEVGEVKSHPPVGHFKNLLLGFGALML